VLFLDKKNCLIADEVQGVARSTMRLSIPEIMRRALELSASASSSCIIIHRATHSLRPTISTSPIKSLRSASP